ncbi:MAG: cytochrome C [Rhodobacteraceae bacterium]|nr:cytochrome C [Paracoccaceae bacterium]
MKRTVQTALLGALLMIPAQHAMGAGQELWRECRVCHMVAAPDGTVLERGGRSAPNLYGIAGRPAASDPGFRRYSDLMQSAGRAGLVWTRENFIAYLRDTNEFMRRYTGDPDGRGHMNASLAEGAGELFDYLEGLSR